MTKMANITPKHFNWRMEGDVAVISLDRSADRQGHEGPFGIHPHDR